LAFAPSNATKVASLAVPCKQRNYIFDNNFPRVITVSMSRAFRNAALVRSMTSHLNNTAAFPAVAGKKLFRQIQHFSQPIQHDYLQLGTRWTRDLEFCGKIDAEID